MERGGGEVDRMVDFDVLGKASLIGWAVGGVVSNLVTLALYLLWRA